MLICRDLRSGTGCGAQNLDSAKECAQCGRSLRYGLVLRNPGDRIGSYKIKRLIGHGGFGAVYEVEVIQRPGLMVTLKETFEADSVRIFQREFNVLRELRHDNLPRYYQVFEAQSSGFLVMEFVPGQSLEELLRKQPGPVLEKLVLHYADQLCDVLAYLHSQDPPILHRDIKPANIRLTPEGLIKLVDFGLLKQGTQTTNTVQHRAGTLSYAPLEQWVGGTDQRSDIYSLGATLYHLLTGQAPQPAGARSSSSLDPLQRPRKLNPRISPILEEALLTALAIDREQRFAAISMFHHELIRSAQMARGTTPLGNPMLVSPASPATPTTVVPAAPAPAPAPRLHYQLRQAHSWAAHYDVVNTLAWSVDGRTLVSGSDDGRVRLWEIGADDRPGESRAFLGGVGRVFCVAWRPDGQVLVSSGKDQVIRQWRAADGSWLGTWSGHVGAVYALSWSPDGKQLVSASEDRTVRVWSAIDGRSVGVLTGHHQPVTAAAWAPNGRLLISASSDTTLKLWQAEPWTLLTTLKGHSRAVHCAVWRPDGQMIASGGADGTVRLWQGADGFPSAILYGHTDAVFALAWSPDGQLLASAGADKTIRLWRVADSALLQIVGEHERGITSLIWRPDGQLLASAGADKSIRLWRVE